MKIILKHVLKNIKEKKIRSLIIILSLIAVSIIMMICISMKDEIVAKYIQTMRGITGDTDIIVSEKNKSNDEDTKEKMASSENASKINVDNLNLPKDEIYYTTITSNAVKIEYKDDYKYALLTGYDLKEAVNMKLFKNEEVTELAEDEILITENTAKDLNVEAGDNVNVIKEDNSRVALKVKIIAPKKGILTREANNVNLLVCSRKTAQNILGFKENEVSSLMIKCNDTTKTAEIKDAIMNNNKEYNLKVQELFNEETLKEACNSIMQIFIIIFVMIVIMVFFVISSLSKIIINERIPVIGTFRSVGATKTKMNLILILENAIYGLIGGTIGAIIGANIKSSISSLFFTTREGVDIANTNGKVSVIYIIAVIAFSVLLQILMSLTAIIKNNKRPIKEIIFNTKTARYKKSYVKTVLGIILIIAVVLLYKLNTKGEPAIALCTIMFSIIAMAFEVPAILSIFSKIFKFFAEKLNMPVLCLASCNIKNNKSIINSSELIVVSLSLMLTLYLVVTSILNIFIAFGEDDKSDIFIQSPSYKFEEYEYLKDIKNVKEIYPEYYAWNTILNDDKKMNLAVIANNGDEFRFNVDKEIYENLKEDEIILDEQVLKKKDLKVGDICKIKLNSESEDEAKRIYKDVRIFASADTTMFSSERKTAVISYELFKKAYGTVPQRICVIVENKEIIEETLSELKNKVDDFGVVIETKEKNLEDQKVQSMSIISAFSALMGMGVALSFIGIINNQIISFMQRKREYAMLYSTSMSKKQLKRLITLETVLSFGTMSFIAVLASYGMGRIMEDGLKAISICLPIKYEIKGIIMLTIAVYIFMILTSIAPKLKLRKMKVIDEIKYE